MLIFVIILIVFINANCMTGIGLHNDIFAQPDIIVSIGKKNKDFPLKGSKDSEKLNKLTFIYAGVRTYGNNGMPYVPALFYIIDFPFSLIFDTILLPVTLPSAGYHYWRTPKLLKTGNLIREINNNNFEGVKQFVKSGADVNYDYYTETPLSLSIQSKNKNIEISKYLIENGGDVNSIVRDKRILRIAIDESNSFLNEEFSFEIAKLLIENGANLNGTSCFYKDTPLTIARQHGNEKLINYLILIGAK